MNMRLSDVLGIVFWIAIIVAPLWAFVRQKARWPDKWAALVRWAPLPIAITAVQSGLAFLMSGTTGFIGTLPLVGMSSTALTLLVTSLLNKPTRCGAGRWPIPRLKRSARIGCVPTA